MNKNGTNSKSLLNVLFLTSAYPNSSNPFLGQFVKDLKVSLENTKNIKVSVLALRTPKNLLKQVKHLVVLWIRLHKVLKRNKPDIIHAHWLIPNGFLSSLTSIPTVTTIYGASVFRGSKNFIIQKMIKFTLKRTNQLVAISQYTKKKVQELAEVDPEIIYFGPSISLTKKIFNMGKEEFEKKENIILMVGSLIPRKGHIYGIKAFEKLDYEKKNIKMIIVGKGPLKEELNKYISEKKLENYIVIKEMLSSNELFNLMVKSKILLHPAIIDHHGDTEGLGLVLIEAILCRTAVVASRVGGITDIVIDNKTGILVEEKNTCQLAEKINFILENPDKRYEFFENFLQVYDKFDYSTISSQYIKIYEKVLSERCKR